MDTAIRFLAAALFALFALDAGARTLYVAASRPNNKGSGRSPAKAKKTIQAAINAARKGDTILVYPGHYARIQSNNKKIRIRSVGGESRTVLLSGVDKTAAGVVVADLAAWSKNVTAYHAYWGKGSDWWTCCSKIRGRTATTLQGFKVRPTSFNSDDGTLWYFESAAAIAGGTAKDCSFEHCGNVWRYLAFDSPGAPGGLECTAAWPTFYRTKLVRCRVFDCNGMEEWYKTRPSDPNSKAATPASGVLAEGSSFQRCTVAQSGSSYSSTRNGGLPDSCNFRNSTFANCLFARNWRPAFKSCTLANCTVADNHKARLSQSTAVCTVFSGVPASQFSKKRKNKLSRCHRGSSPGFVRPPAARRWTADDEAEFVGHCHWDDEGLDDTWRWDEAASVWAMCDAVDADFRLAPGSPCIDRGRLTKAQKKIVGTKDLDGRRRTRGKAVDIGCYEF